MKEEEKSRDSDRDDKNMGKNLSLRELRYYMQIIFSVRCFVFPLADADLCHYRAGES